MELPTRGDAPLYETVFTLLLEAGENGKQLGWIAGAIWPPKGSAVELYEPNRDATVTGTRLSLGPDGVATVFGYLDVPEPDVFLPKDAGA